MILNRSHNIKPTINNSQTYINKKIIVLIGVIYINNKTTLFVLQMY